MRYVPYTRQVRDPVSDEFRGIANTAFALRPVDKGCLSLTWIEHYGPKSQATVVLAATRFGETLEKKKLPPKAYFAIGQAGETRSVCANHNNKIRLVHAPDGPNTGHVELRRFNDDELRLLEVLTVEVYREHMAVANFTKTL